MKRWIRRVLVTSPHWFLWALCAFVAVCVVFALVWFGTYSFGLRD